MPMEQTVQTLKRYRCNAIFEKKKHFNAANRKIKYNNVTQCIIISLSAIAGSVLVVTLKEQAAWVSYIIAGMSLLVAVLSAIQKFYEWQKQADKHQEVGTQYLELVRHINMSLSQLNDTGDEASFCQEAGKIRDAYDSVSRLASAASTNNRDYQKARDGIAAGEETYTDDDMKIGE